jgi:hypothetical protein
MPALRKYQVGEKITADMINGIVDSIRESQINSVVGGTFKRGSGGTTISINSPQKATSSSINITYPFEYYSGGTVSAPWFGIRAGTINGILPTNIASTFGLTLNTERFVNLECESDGKTVQSAEIVAESSPPSPVAATPEIAPSNFKLNIYYISPTLVPFRTIGTSSIAATTQEVIREPITGVAFGEMPYRPWYTWIFAS